MTVIHSTTLVVRQQLTPTSALDQLRINGEKTLDAMKLLQGAKETKALLFMPNMEGFFQA
jgi:hypothetical protein